MSLSVGELGRLLNLMTDENMRQQSFEQLSTAFHSVFAKTDSFKVGCCLVQLLQLPDLLPHPPQQLAAIFLLHDMYKPEMISLNPFAPIFVHLLTATDQPQARPLPKLTPGGKGFLYSLLSGSLSKEVYKKTPLQIIQTEVTSLPPIDISELQLALVGRQSELPRQATCAIPCIISDPDSQPTSAEYGGDFTSILPEVQRRVVEEICCKGLSQRWTRPTFFRLIPPPLFLPTEPMLPPIPIDSHSFCLDEGMLADERSSETDIKRMLIKAIKEPLPASIVEQLVTELAKSPNLAQSFGLTPAKLPSLVQTNPPLVVEFMKKMQGSSQLNDYFSALFQMEMCVQSLEVVNRLTGDMPLPPEFLHLYVRRCIDTCEQTTDKVQQNRYVRLVCVFLQSLIRNKAIDVNYIFIDVQAFCIEFTRMKEAAALFRLLKALGSGEVPLSAGSGSVSEQPATP